MPMLAVTEAAARLAPVGLKAAANDVAALRLLARASVRLGRDSSAKAIYHRLGPEAMLADDLCLLGIALTRAGNRQGAVEVWEQARAADPNHAETLFELTRAYSAGDQLAKAAETAHRLASSPVWQRRAGSAARHDPVGAERSIRCRHILATGSRNRSRGKERCLHPGCPFARSGPRPCLDAEAV